MRKNKLHEVGLFSIDKRIHGSEDWDLWLKLSKCNARFKFIKEVLGIYILDGSNMSGVPNFHERSRYVFETHVSSILPTTREVEVKIRGSRAIHDLISARSLLCYGEYRKACKVFLKSLLNGWLNAFFWNRVFDRSYSLVKRFLR